MKAFTGLVLFCLIVLFAGLASADGKWRRGSELDSATSRTALCGALLSAGQTCFHTYTAADTNSFVIQTQSLGTLCLNPDVDTAGAATATGKLWKALTSSKVIDAENWMQILSGQILDGDFLATPQTACFFLLDPGIYYWESVVPPGGGETAVVSFTSY